MDISVVESTTNSSILQMGRDLDRYYPHFKSSSVLNRVFAHKNQLPSSISTSALLPFVFCFFILPSRFGGCLPQLEFVPEESAPSSLFLSDPEAFSLSYRDVLRDSYRISFPILPTRRGGRISCCFLTPWNSDGYNLTAEFAEKFTHLSPAWFILKFDQRFLVEGPDLKSPDLILWRSQLRGKKVRLVPRIAFELPGEILQRTVKDHDDSLLKSLCKVVIESFLRLECDGMVLDLQGAIFSLVRPEETPDSTLLEKLIGYLSVELQSIGSSHSQDLGIVLPAFLLPSSSIRQLLKAGASFVTLNTYDHSSGDRPGPQAPLPWVRSALIRSIGNLKQDLELSPKVSLGLHFYGYDYSNSAKAEAIIGEKYLKLLRRWRPKLQRDFDSEEIFFRYSDATGNHIVYYPSLVSIQKRLELADEFNSGISVWEAGQGLPIFFDLL